MNYEALTKPKDVLDGMIEIEFVGDPSSGFRRTRETLERMGIPKAKGDVLVQTAHILHKRGKYYICHFKELFALDGRAAAMTKEDVSRRNRIALYLTDWNIIKPVNLDHVEMLCPPSSLKIVKYDQRETWTLTKKYNIGGNSNNHE